MVSLRTLEEVADRMGWTRQTMLEVACDFIDNQAERGAFEAYLKQRAADEEDLGEEEAEEEDWDEATEDSEDDG